MNFREKLFIKFLWLIQKNVGKIYQNVYVK